MKSPALSTDVVKNEVDLARAVLSVEDYNDQFEDIGDRLGEILGGFRSLDSVINTTGGEDDPVLRQRLQKHRQQFRLRMGRRSRGDGSGPSEPSTDQWTDRTDRS